MSRETEKMFKQLHKFIDENGGENLSEEEMEKLTQVFVDNFNKGLYRDVMDVTEETAETSDDFIQLAEESEDYVKALKYARKALKLNPDNLDAELFIAFNNAESAFEMQKKLQVILKHGNEIMEKEGYFVEDMGHFWGILETRPYMRVRFEYLMTLLRCGMFKKAINECEGILKLNESDNLGVRYILLNLYTFFEDEEKSAQLQKRYALSYESQGLLSLSFLQFKLGNFIKSKNYLKKLEQINKDTKKFLKLIYNGKIHDYIMESDDYGYSPNTMSELVYTFKENQYLYNVPEYFEWGYLELKKKKAKTVKLKKRK